MMISLQRTVPPTVEPITLDQAKAHCRVTGDQDDAIIATYMQAAREYAEARLGRAIMPQTWRFSREHFPGCFGLGRVYSGYSANNLQGYGGGGAGYLGHLAILLPRPKLTSVVSVAYLDPSGNRQILDPGGYVADLDSEPARVVPATGCYWPATMWGRSDNVQVTYTAGYAVVPASVQLAILGLTAHWYENRESVVLTSSPNASTIVPQFVESLLVNEAAPTVFTFED